MTCDTDHCDHDWHYASPRTVAGALQRGLGRGARRAMVDPAAPDLVTDCLRRDYRWSWQVDQRDVYLARLVRDLRLPLAPITALLYAAPPEESDHDNAFTATLDVLEVLGRAGVDGAVDEARRCIREGDRWLDTLQTVARAWPIAWWDDLYPAVADRLNAADEPRPLWLSPPWTHWAQRDPRIAAAASAARSRPGPPRPFADTPTADLLAALREPDRADQWRPVLRELRRRPPEPGLLELVDTSPLTATGGPLGGAILRLGVLAVPAARRWAATEEHPLRWTALELLAAHGDTADAPALVAGLDWLDSRPDELCGYDDLAGGLARIGGPTATSVLPRLRRLWFSPHSHERASYLRALVTLDPARAPRLLTEGLWDCEEDVRLLAAQRAPLDDATRERLEYLRDDPIETADIRATARSRLT